MAGDWQKTPHSAPADTLLCSMNQRPNAHTNEWRAAEWPARRRRRREFAAQSEWGREASAAGRGGQGRGHQSSRGASAGGPVRGRAGCARAEGEGRSPLHNPAAAALGTPRAVRPPENGRRIRPARPLRPASAVRAPPPPSGSAAPTGCACPVPPLPHPGRPGVAHLLRCPRPPCPAEPPRPASRARVPPPPPPPHTVLA